MSSTVKERGKDVLDLFREVCSSMSFEHFSLLQIQGQHQKQSIAVAIATSRARTQSCSTVQISSTLESCSSSHLSDVNFRIGYE